MCAFAALSGFLFLNALYLQDVRGYTPLHAGLLTLPMAAMIGLLPPVSARLISSRGPRVPLLIAGVAIAASTLLLALVLSADTPIGVLVVAYVLFGIGFGMVNAPITTTAVAGMPLSQAGVAGAVASTSRQTGAALGVAVLGSLVTSGIAGPFAAGFASAARPAWVVMIACGLAIAGLGIAATGRRAQASAARTAELIDEPHAAADLGGGALILWSAGPPVSRRPPGRGGEGAADRHGEHRRASRRLVQVATTH